MGDLKCLEHNCDFCTQQVKQLQNHLQDVHKFNMAKDTLTFTSKEGTQNKLN